MAQNYSGLTDVALMMMYQDGDHMAFSILYERHKSKVYSYLEKRLHDKSHLDDLHQRVFVKFHKSRHLYNKKYEVLPWLYTITRSELLDFFKKRKIETVEFNENLFSDEVDEDSIIDLQNEKSLSEKEKVAIENRYLKDKDFAEISNLLETSQSNVRKIISRGLKKLRIKYKGEEA